MPNESIEQEVKNQFGRMVSAINALDFSAWSENFSKDNFLSAIAGSDYYATRSEWIDTIKNYFSMRDRQRIEPITIEVNALTPQIALLTSAEKTEMLFKNGDIIKSRHVFTILWKKEQDGWKVLHSHESWLEE